jgi:hypothetical protein
MRSDVAGGSIQEYLSRLRLRFGARLAAYGRDDLADIKVWCRTLAQVADQHTAAGRSLMGDGTDIRISALLLSEKLIADLLRPIPDPLLRWVSVPIRVDWPRDICSP